MAIKFETASGPQAKPAEKKAAAPRPVDAEESIEGSAEEVAGGKAPGKKIKQRSSFKKKSP
jgi:hypothetical protein